MCDKQIIILNGLNSNKITKSGLYQIPENVNILYFQLVGGSGGGGHSKCGGGGGAAGQVKNNSFDVQAGRILDIIIGKGGKSGKCKVNGQAGGDSILKYNNDIYTSIGGGGGKADGQGGDYLSGTTVDLTLDSGDPAVKSKIYVGGEGGIVGANATGGINGTRGGFGSSEGCISTKTDGQDGFVLINFSNTTIPPSNDKPIELTNFTDSGNSFAYIGSNVNIPDALKKIVKVLSSYIRPSASQFVNVTMASITDSSGSVQVDPSPYAPSQVPYVLISAGAGGGGYGQFIASATGVQTFACGGGGESGYQIGGTINNVTSIVSLGQGGAGGAGNNNGNGQNGQPGGVTTILQNNIVVAPVPAFVPANPGKSGGNGGAGGQGNSNIFNPPTDTNWNSSPGTTGNYLYGATSTGSITWPTGGGTIRSPFIPYLGYLEGKGGQGGYQTTKPGGIDGTSGAMGSAIINGVNILPPSVQTSLTSSTNSTNSTSFISSTNSTNSTSSTSLQSSTGYIHYILKVPSILFTIKNLALYLYPTIHIAVNLFKDAQNTEIKYNSDSQSLTISHTYTQDVIFPIPKGIHNLGYEIKGGDGAGSGLGELLRGTQPVQDGSLVTLKIGPGGFSQSDIYQNGRISSLKGVISDNKIFKIVAGGGKGQVSSDTVGKQGYIKLTINVLIANLI